MTLNQNINIQQDRPHIEPLAVVEAKVNISVSISTMIIHSVAIASLIIHFDDTLLQFLAFFQSIRHFQ